MSSGPTDETASKPQRHGPLFYIGATSLLAAMAVETIAVIGRQIASPLLGALEIIQTAILLTASVAMLSATLSNTHATVHLLTDRLPEGTQRALRRLAAFLSALFFTGLSAASLWLIVEFWNSHEESELLHIPFRPLRIISFLAIVAIAGVLLRNTARPLPGRLNR